MKFPRRVVAMLISTLPLFGCGPSNSTKADPVLAKVGSTLIRASDVEALMASAPARARTPAQGVTPTELPGGKASGSTEELEKRRLQVLIDQAVVLEMARRQGFDREPSFRKASARHTQQFLQLEYRKWLYAHELTVTDAEIAKYRKEHAAELKAWVNNIPRYRNGKWVRFLVTEKEEARRRLQSEKMAAWMQKAAAEVPVKREKP